MKLGKLAITLPAAFFNVKQAVDLAVRAEKEWNYPAIWLAETGGALFDALFEHGAETAKIDCLS